LTGKNQQSQGSDGPGSVHPGTDGPESDGPGSVGPRTDSPGTDGPGTGYMTLPGLYEVTVQKVLAQELTVQEVS